MEQLSSADFVSDEEEEEEKFHILLCFSAFLSVLGEGRGLDETFEAFLFFFSTNQARQPKTLLNTSYKKTLTY